MKKAKAKVRTRLIPDHMRDRAMNAIDKLIASGSLSQADLINLCDKRTQRKVAALPPHQQHLYFRSLAQGYHISHCKFPLLRKEQYLTLAKHFHINLLWLWTGYGPQFSNTTNN